MEGRRDPNRGILQLIGVSRIDLNKVDVFLNIKSGQCLCFTRKALENDPGGDEAYPSLMNGGSNHACIMVGMAMGKQDRGDIHILDSQLVELHPRVCNRINEDTLPIHPQNKTRGPPIWIESATGPDKAHTKGWGFQGLFLEKIGWVRRELENCGINLSK